MANSSFNTNYVDDKDFSELDFGGLASNETAVLEYSMVLNPGSQPNSTESSPKMTTLDDNADYINNIKRITMGQVIPVLYFLLFVLGVTGNSVVIYVSCFLTKKSKNTVDIFVGNLAIADLALIATLPFWAVTNILGGTWVFHDWGCKVLSFLTHLNMFASVFLITAMAIDRYTVVVKAVKVRAKSLRTARRTMFSCAVIWVFSFILSLPAAIMREKLQMHNTTTCSWKYPPHTRHFWTAMHLVTRNIIGFVIPLSVICRCYCVIVGYVRSRSAPQQNISESRSGETAGKQQRRVTSLVTAIIMAFVICWFPNQLSNFSHSLMRLGAIPWPETTQAKNIQYFLHVFTAVLSFCNSVLNPIIYSTSPTHRMHMKILFSRVFRCFKNAKEDDRMYAEYHAITKDPGFSPKNGTRRITEVSRLQPLNYDCAIGQCSNGGVVISNTARMKTGPDEGFLTTKVISGSTNVGSAELTSPKILVRDDSSAFSKQQCGEELSVKNDIQEFAEPNQQQQDEEENIALL